VSFSGGKDSTVLLDLTLAVKPDLDIIWFDDGWDYPETISFLAAVEARLGRRILRVEMPVRSSFWGREIAYGGDDPSYSHACDMDYEAWARQYTGALIGMRKEESKQRYFTLLRRGEVYYHKGLGHWHCCPLASWTWQDVWGYILGNGLSYNPVYDRLEKLGVAPAQARVGPLTAWMVYQYGALATLKRGWPDLYNRFCAAHPEARAYG
jgi:phosphoadenosine phosphosulfate reductase